MRLIACLPKLFLISFLLVAGCESSEERAERFFQSGLTLFEAGDVDRALVEFRNVLALNVRHKEARLTYANIQRERGDISDAYGHYLRLVEQYPDTPEALLPLTEIAIAAENWEEAETHGRAVSKLIPHDPKVIVFTALLNYRAAALSGDEDAAAVEVAKAREILGQTPQNIIARKIVIDDLLGRKDDLGVLEHVEAALVIEPAQIDLQMLRLNILGKFEDPARFQAALEAMSTQFPEQQEIQQMLIAWYVQQENLPAAESYLRTLAVAPDADPAAKLVVVDFLKETKGLDAAKAELDALLASDPDNNLIRAMRAAMLFAQNEQQDAIVEMTAIVDGSPSSDKARNFKIVLSQMLRDTGNGAESRKLAEQVLREDEGHVEALKLKAAWLLSEDNPSDAILALRTALGQAPNDTSVITMIGQAHEQQGDYDLAGERFALAAEVSNYGADESERYARLLLAQSRDSVAESILLKALEAHPTNVNLLATMAEIQLLKNEWNRVTRIIWQLRAQKTEFATGVADAIETEALLRQERVGETLSFLEEVIARGDTSIASKAKLVEIQVRENRLDEARKFLRGQLAETPDEPTLRFLQAGVFVLSKDVAAAEVSYRGLIDEYPDNEQVLRALYALLARQDRFEEADVILDTAIAANPSALMPRMMKATRREELHDFEGAIAIYEELYAENNNNFVIANNLASMLTIHRDSPKDIERAFAIARRLQGSDIPPFQDTYGWIAYKLGNYEEALRYLEPAALGLPSDPMTQLHLGMTYLAMERRDDARDVLTRVLELAGNSRLPQFNEVRQILDGPLAN